jgi:pimeloyl-ACP methyl ester carboxylesterase
MERPLTRTGRERMMTESIRVDGQQVHVWPGTRPDAPVVIAAHGITANGLSWGPVAEQLHGAVTLLAPDLRGRAGSRDLPGGYGLAGHGDDLVAILDHLGIRQAALAGHSMGAYVAALAAVRHPTRTTGVVMVDGGLSFPPPAGTDVDALLAAILGPALGRLDATFADREAYRQFWRSHPAFRFDWSPQVDTYLQHDLVGTGPFRSSCVAEAVRVDGAQMLADPAVSAAIHSLPVPGVLLYADRGLLDQAPGAYNATSLAGLAVPAVRVPDTNHYSILLAAPGAAVVAEHILRAVQPHPDRG